MQCANKTRFGKCFLYLVQIFEPAIAAPQKVASAQLCDSTAKTSFEMEDSLSVRTDFSSSNKRSACSKRRRIMIKMLSQPSHCQLDPMILITIAIRGRSHKLCWQEEVGRYVQKYCLFVNFYKVENVTCSGVGSQKMNKKNGICFVPKELFFF